MGSPRFSSASASGDDLEALLDGLADRGLEDLVLGAEGAIDAAIAP